MLAWRNITHRSGGSSQAPKTDQDGQDLILSTGKCQAGQGLRVTIWSKSTSHWPKAPNLWFFWLLAAAACSSPRSSLAQHSASRCQLLCCAQSVPKSLWAKACSLTRCVSITSSIISIMSSQLSHQMSLTTQIGWHSKNTTVVTIPASQ